VADSFLGFFVLGIDGFDVTAIGFIAPALIDDWQISRHMLGPVMMSGLFGLAAGSLISGPLADRYGRKNSSLALSYFLAQPAFCVVVEFIQPDLFSLYYRPGAGCCDAQYHHAGGRVCPWRYRSRLATVIHCGFNTGAALGGLLSQQLLGTFGWRSVLITGGVLPLIFALILIRYLPESMQYLVQDPANKQRLTHLLNKFVPGIADAKTHFYTSEPQKAHASTARSLLHPPYTFGTLALWLTLFAGLFCVYLLSSWLPLMVRDTGMTLSQAVIMGSVFQIGGMMGNFCIGIEMDRWGRHCAIILTLIGGACSALILGMHIPSLPVLCVLVLMLGFTVNGISPGCYALAAHFYPTSIGPLA
jgi:AAHS family 4-hydroxybenzoate transporter-like MFS transporter